MSLLISHKSLVGRKRLSRLQVWGGAILAIIIGVVLLIPCFLYIR